MKLLCNFHGWWKLLCPILFLLTPDLIAQQILLDRPSRAGELTLFPDISKPNDYYYVLDKVRMAAHEDETPQFSFLNYVKNAADGAQGGGIVHAVVELYVTDEQIRDAEQDLRRINPNGKIIGPVMWKGGTIALISSFADTNGDLTEQVIGLGKAPILDGQKAAVSLQLTQKGAEILWESFKLPTPDMSISFEMELEGYRAPKQAIIEANFDRVYDHKAFQIGLAAPILAADINAAFDDLREQGAIKITNIGSDEQMDLLIATAYNKLTEIMFEPLGGTGTPDISQLAAAAAGQGTNILDRATQMLSQARQEARQENERIRKENAAEKERVEAENEEIRSENATTSAGNGNNNGTSTQNDTTATANSDSTQAGRPLPRGQQARPSEGERVAAASPDDRPGTVMRQEEQPQLQEEQIVPPLAIAASFQIKRVRRQGTFRIDLNKSSTDRVTLRFDENFGPYTKNCRTCFSQVNLDNPLYKQREVAAFVDGMNAQDFGEYINFVTVNLIKEHEKGAVSQDEVRIDRNNFNQEGNNFKLIYGWKEDNNREQWLDYRYQTTWSFFGGHTVAIETQKGQEGAINLSPPFQRKIVHFSADPTVLAASEVRLINVRVFYTLGDKELSKQVTINTGTVPLAGAIEFILPKGEYEYEYEIEWRLRGNRMLTSGRQRSSFTDILVDELPI